MFKNAILALASMVALFSGIGMVSAFESHVVNVEAHVENALTIPTTLNFGTVFPEEWFTELIPMGLSSSFCETDPLQDRVSHVEGLIYFAKKPNFDHWLGDAIYMRLKSGPGAETAPVDANDFMVRMDTRSSPANKMPPSSPMLVGLPTTGPSPPALLTTHHFVFVKPVRNRISLWVGLDVPVFEDFHNPGTDVDPKPSGLPTPTVIIEKGEARYNPEGVDLGMDLIIQVTSIHNPGSEGLCDPP